MYLQESKLHAQSAIPVVLDDAGRKFVAQVIWYLFDRNKDRTITLKWKFVNLNFRVAQLEPVIFTFVGPRPPAIEGSLNPFQVPAA